MYEQWKLGEFEIGPAPRAGLQLSYAGPLRYTKILQAAFPRPARWYGPYESFSTSYDWVLYSLSIPADRGTLVKRRSTPQLKDLTEPEKLAALEGSYEITANLEGKTIVMVDDLVFSGSTLSLSGRACPRSWGAPSAGPRCHKDEADMNRNLENAKLWTALMKAPGVGPKRVNEIMKRLADAGISLAEATGENPRQLVSLGVRPEWLADINNQDRVAPSPLPQQIQVLTPESEDYPLDRVSPVLPLAPVLYAVGNVRLLTAGGVSISGSRSASMAALSYARELAQLLARAGLNVVSGHAAGIDEMAHSAALASEGTTTIVAAEGLAPFRPKKSLDLSDSDSFLIVSEFEPNAKWTGFRAMQRNTTIAALSNAVVVVAAGTKGGSWSQGNLCLKAKKRLFVPDVPTSEAPGNRRLIEMGATPIDPKNPAAVLDRLADVDLSEAQGDQLRFLT